MNMQWPTLYHTRGGERGFTHLTHLGTRTQLETTLYHKAANHYFRDSSTFIAPFSTTTAAVCNEAVVTAASSIALSGVFCSYMKLEWVWRVRRLESSCETNNIFPTPYNQADEIYDLCSYEVTEKTEIQICKNRCFSSLSFSVRIPRVLSRAKNNISRSMLHHSCVARTKYF